MKTSTKSLWLALCAVLLAAPATAQSTIRSLPRQERLLDSYIAQIGINDLHNSSGVRLTQPWQILRQDRANFHRFGYRDPFDQGDSFFGDPVNRSTMEKMLMSGSITPQAARDIVTGGALVLVEVYGYGSTGRSIHVTVAK